jgi:hypothetical protein
MKLGKSRRRWLIAAVTTTVALPFYSDSAKPPGAEHRYVMFLEDETERPPQKNVRLAYADRAEGPGGRTCATSCP